MSRTCIETDHDGIFILLDELSGMVDKDLKITKRLEYAQILLDYATEHCIEEENEMRMCGYPHLNDHLSAHDDLQNHFGLIIRDLLGDKSTLLDLLNSVRNVFIRHIITLDEHFRVWKKQQTEDPS